MFKLSIVSPERVLYEKEVLSIQLPGSQGYLGVLSHHAPLITSLVPGLLTIKESDSLELFAAISGGFLEVSGNVATVLADSVEFREEIDVDRARSALDRARQRLSGDLHDIDVERAKAAELRAKNRLKIAAAE